jgi:uncharacterized protein (DUF1684 family)
MKTQVFVCFSILISLTGLSQNNSYYDSIRSYQDNYRSTHGVVKGADQKQIHFFPVNEELSIPARFEQIYEAPWFKMETSGSTKAIYRVYGILHFSIKDNAYKLHIYQSKDLMNRKEYAEHLFIPFTDETCGEESYENGRYIDLSVSDLSNGQYVLDFNKAYNPYCAYISDTYNCPIPPKENQLPVAIKAGEMKFGKGH